MIEKPKRPKKLNNQDRKIPASIQELINRYDLENNDVYDFLDYLVANFNNLPEVIDNLTSTSSTNSLSARQGKILKQSQDDIEEKLNYSEQEQVIGTYLGKPHYRKVTKFTFQASHSNEQVNIPHGISNLKMITDFKCTVPTGNGSGYLIPFTNMNGSSNSFEGYNSQYMFFDIRNDSWGSGRTFYMTIEYTKTTD